MTNADNTVKQEAKTWIDQINAGTGMSGGWRLESISKRYRYFKSSETGTQKRVPVRIRRFTRGIPWGLVYEAIRYLESLAPYTDIIFNGERVTLAYRPTNTIWVRDDQHAVDGNAQGTYTLIQDLIEDGSTDDLQTPSSSSCSEEVVSKWVWDASTIEDFPSGGQGVIYSIQAVHRNEDGTFDYTLVKRTAKTQHLEESVSECNSFETVTTEIWDNVYGTPDAPRDDTGVSLPIPEGCSGTDGVTVVRQVSENQDCTMRITVQRHTAKSVVSATSCGKTKYEHTDGETKRAQTAPLGEAPAPTGGKVVTHKSEKRQDGLFDNTVNSKQELPVEKSTLEIRKTLKGVVTSRTDRNQPESSVPPSPSGMRVGETFRSTVTEGGLHDNVHEAVDPTPVGDTGGGCNKTVFEETDTQSSNVADKPDNPHGTAGGGTWSEKVLALTEMGTWDYRTVVHRETAVSGTALELRKTLRGVVRSVTDKNQASASVPSSASSMKVGETYRSTMNPGGSFDNIHEVVENEPVGDTGFGCNKTIFEETDSTAENVAERPDAGHGTAGGGTWTEVSASITEYGTWDKRTVEHHETPVASAVVELRKTVRGTIRTTTDRNQASASVPSSSVGMAIGETYRSTMTQGGRFDNVHEVADTVSIGSIGESCTRTPNLHSHSTSENVRNKPSIEQTAEVNEEHSKTARITEYGTWDVETKTVTYQPWGPIAVSTATGPFRTVKTEVFQNVVNAPSRTAGTNEDVSVNVSKNDHGSYDGRIVTEIYKPWGVETIATASSTFRTVTIQGFQNLTSVPSRTVGANHEINVSASVNNHGTFDGRITEETFSPWGPQTIATAASAFRTVTIEAFQNNTSVPFRSAGVNADIDVSASLNSHGTFDGRIVKHQYQSWGPSLVATTTSSLKSTSHYAFQNAVSAPSPAAGTNEELSMSVSLNGHGTFDGRYTKETFTGWRGTIATATGPFRTTTITGFQNQTSAPNESAGVNADIDVSASINGHGTFDGRVVKHQYTSWSGTIGTASCPGHTTTITAGMNSSSPPNISGSTGTEVSVSASLNGHGTFDWNAKQTTYIPTSGQASANWATETSTTVVERRTSNMNVSPSEKKGHASISLDDAGTATTTVTSYDPIAVTSGWIEWESEEKVPDHTYKYKCGYQTFCNQSAPPKPPSGTSASIRVSINKFGLFDGTVSYKHLESWVNASNDTSDSGSASAIGYFYVNGKKYKIEASYRKSIKGWVGTLYHHPGLPGGVHYTAIKSITPISSPTGL